ncbi:amidohydrolase family protein [Geofilum rubicundum]|uniref:Dihydropyrimidinase n=1 Tax=Geofilum rubicundum JCM 15548 TaxID=1236989 RepID=A0A0E9M0Q4_9BACT|nr:amidohydrolase family protein [Geofilum rubicundum]GAO31079.1 dihydropyrimidinase [Geofilum rubicundum JCM 15548]
MQYTLLKNGLIVQPHRVLKGDLLIGNSRIMQIGAHLSDPNPETKIVDIQGKYILPGLIHYRSPFLKIQENAQFSAIYIALSHGGTFLMDVLKISKTTGFKESIEEARMTSQPIITDFSLHLDASSANKLSDKALNHCFIKEGATSFTLKWKHIHQLIEGKMKHLLNFIASNQLLLICESGTIKDSSLIGHPKFFASYLKQLSQAIEILRGEGTQVLITDIVSKEELDLIFGDYTSFNDNIYAAINLADTSIQIPEALTKEQLLTFGTHPNILLDPPILQSPSKGHQFIENKTMYSFLQNIVGGKAVTQKSLITLCNMYATRPAKLLGAYPQKGTLEPGADADLIIWSPVKSSSGLKPGANTSLLRTDIKGIITNGRFITEDDLIISDQLNGRYIYRNQTFEGPAPLITR